MQWQGQRSGARRRPVPIGTPKSGRKSLHASMQDPFPLQPPLPINSNPPPQRRQARTGPGIVWKFCSALPMAAQMAGSLSWSGDKHFCGRKTSSRPVANVPSTCRERGGGVGCACGESAWRWALNARRHAMQRCCSARLAPPRQAQATPSPGATAIPWCQSRGRRRGA